MVNTRSQRIRMSDVSALTLRADRMTTSRRVSPVPQLTCRGSACKLYQPDVVQCVPMGSSYGDASVEWKCEAELPSALRFGQVQVSCEGWDGPDDEYVLRGSCGLTYELVRTNKALDADSSWSSGVSSYAKEGESMSWLSIALLAIIAWMIWSALRPRPTNTTPTNRRQSSWRNFFSGGGGGGPGGPGFGGGPASSAPPPPYTKFANTTTGAPGASSSSSSWQPGFWTGAMAGAAGLAGFNALRGDGGPRTRARYDDGVLYDEDFGRRRAGPAAGGFWGGGNNRFAAGPSVRRSSDSGGLGPMRTSSGFGGTSNR